MNIFSRASKLMPLAPGERAFLKTLQGLIISAIIVGLQAATQYIAAPGTLDRTRIIEECVLLAMFSLLHGILKYLTANGDAGLQMLAAAADQELTNVQQSTQNYVMDGGRGTTSMPVAPKVQRASTPPPVPVPVQYQATAAMPMQQAQQYLTPEQAAAYQQMIAQQQYQAQMAAQQAPK